MIDTQVLTKGIMDILKTDPNFKYKLKAYHPGNLQTIDILVEPGPNPYYAFLKLIDSEKYLHEDLPEIRVGDFGYVKVSNIVEHAKYLVCMGVVSDLEEIQYPALVRTPYIPVTSLYMTIYTSDDIEALFNFVKKE